MGEKPKQRSDGMWYVGSQPFSSERSALEYQKVVNAGRRQIIGAWVPIVMTVAILAGGWWWLNNRSDAQTQRVGREFASMQECLDFIEMDMGESLQVQTDKPGDVSGKGVISGMFFRCEQKNTGTRGSVLEGRWDRPK